MEALAGECGNLVLVSPWSSSFPEVIVDSLSAELAEKAEKVVCWSLDDR